VVVHGDCLWWEKAMACEGEQEDKMKKKKDGGERR